MNTRALALVVAMLAIISIASGIAVSVATHVVIEAVR